MTTQLTLYRTAAQVKRDFLANGVSIFWLSRRNAARLSPAAYQKLRRVALRNGVSRLMVSRKMLQFDPSQVPDDILEACIKQRAIMPGRVLDTRRLPDIKSDIHIVDYYNAAGEKIRAIMDLPEGRRRSAAAPWVIIPPAFGKRKETYFLLALYLKRNGFGVLRYDDSLSIGESDGQIQDLTLSRSSLNIVAALDYLTETIGAENIGVIPFSLSARPAIKAATFDQRIKFLMPIVGSPNISSLLERVYGEDLIGDYQAGQRKGMMQILGHFVDSDSFLADTVKKGFVDLESTKRDMRRVKAPVIWYCGQDDPWVDPAEVEQVLGAGPPGAGRQLRLFPGLTHRFREAELAMKTFAQAVRDAAWLAEGRQLTEIPRHSLLEIRRRAVAERARIKPIISEEENLRLWTNYLEGFGVIKESDDYMEYLADLAGQLDLKPDEQLLDAGCGNGYVIEFLLGRIANDIVRGKREWSQTGRIIGLDMVAEALEKARQTAAQIKHKKRGLPQTEFVKHNIDKQRLPFKDWQFDKIVASLLLSYLNDRDQAVRELCRVLKPGGTIVLTSLKPDADISQIYARFIEKLKAKYPEEEQRNLWRLGRDLFNQAVSWIEGKEEEGMFEYLSHSQLGGLLKENGIVDLKVIRSFGDMVIMVVGTKSR